MTLGPHLRGHLLLFDRRLDALHAADTGARLLLAAAFLEVLRLGYVRWLSSTIPLWAAMPLLLALALTAVRLGAQLRLPQIGFRPWREWTLTERSYLLQVIVIANVVFLLVLGGPLRARYAASTAWTFWSMFVPYLFYGFYQEVVYRGMVQRELVRRWGGPSGVLAANLLYTFGPLHAYSFASPASVAVPTFAATFAIGLLFGLLYWRSGNLWIVATMHAIGNAYIVTSLRPPG